MTSPTYNETQERKKYSDKLERYRIAIEIESEVQENIDEIDMSLDNPTIDQETRDILVANMEQCLQVKEVVNDNLEHLALSIANDLIRPDLVKQARIKQARQYKQN
jgi:hypothetical protein